MTKYFKRKLKGLISAGNLIRNLGTVHVNIHRQSSLSISPCRRDSFPHLTLGLYERPPMQCKSVSTDINAILTTLSQICLNLNCIFMTPSHVQPKYVPNATCYRRVLYTLYGWIHSSTYRLGLWPPKIFSTVPQIMGTLHNCQVSNAQQ